MMYLEHLQVLDQDILASLCANTRLSSHPDLGNHRDVILQAYVDYVNAAGAAPTSHPMLPVPLVEAMKSVSGANCSAARVGPSREVTRPRP
mgnify:CR=1 FL=1